MEVSLGFQGELQVERRKERKK